MRILPNQNINVVVQAGEELVEYRTRVEDIKGDMLAIGTPIVRGVVVPLRIGTKVSLNFRNDSINEQGRFSNTAIIERRVNKNAPILWLRLTDSWEKTQERIYVRVDVLLDAIYAPINDDEVQTTRNCSIRNLSGGGLWMVSQDKLPESSLLWICLQLESIALQVQGQVVRISPDEDGESYGYGVSFIDLAEKERQQIIRYVYQRQLELRRRGAL